MAFDGESHVKDPNIHHKKFPAAYWPGVPDSGTWKVGDWVINVGPAIGDPPGWVCTVAGTPGTWVAMAVLTPLP